MAILLVLRDALPASRAAADALEEVRVTVACSLSENEKVVPVDVFARLMPASRLPSRHLAVDWRACCSTGGGDGSLGAEVGGGWAGVVVEVVPRVPVVKGWLLP